MTGPALQLIGGPGRDRRPGRDPSAGGAGWLDWLRAHLDPVWRPGEWDNDAKLFTGDLHSDRTAAWPCRTPGCPTATRRPHGRCDGCRRARTGAGLSWEDFDADPPRHPLRPLLPVGVARCPVARVSCSAAVCVSGTNGLGAAVRSSPSPISLRWLVRCRVPRTAWSPAAPESTSAAAGCAGSTTTVTCEPIRPHDPPMGWPGGRQRRHRSSGCISSAWPGWASCSALRCSTRCNNVTSPRRRWIPPRCGSCWPA